MSDRQMADGSDFLNLLATLTITTPLAATTGSVLPAPPGKLPQVKYLVAQAVFTYGSGGTSVDAYVQTSLDQGATWIDVMEFNFLLASATKISACSIYGSLPTVVAPTDGSLASNTVVAGILGDRFRIKYKSAGTYAGGTSVQVVAWAKG